jgi:hypothetical protein
VLHTVGHAARQRRAAAVVGERGRVARGKPRLLGRCPGSSARGDHIDLREPIHVAAAVRLLPDASQHSARSVRDTDECNTAKGFTTLRQGSAASPGSSATGRDALITQRSPWFQLWSHSLLSSTVFSHSPEEAPSMTDMANHQANAHPTTC